MNDSEFSEYGFAAGEIRGTRAWRVDSRGRLRGVTYKQLWRPGENTSECLRTTLADSVSPAATRYAAGGVLPAVLRTGSLTGSSASSVLANIANTMICGCGCGQLLPQRLDEFVPNPCDGMDPSCLCGFYAYQEGSNDYYRPLGNGTGTGNGTGNGGPIGGVVRGFGKVVLGTRGFRAEKAEILALYIDTEALQTSENKVTASLIRLRVERNYGVPVFSEYLTMLQEFPPDAPEPDDDFWKAP